MELARQSDDVVASVHALHARQRNFWGYRSCHFLSTLQLLSNLSQLTLYANSVYSWSVRSRRTGNRMEFLEAPAFTRYLSRYLTDDEYRELQNRLPPRRILATLSPEREDFGSFAGA